MNAYLQNVVRILSDVRAPAARIAAYNSGFGLILATEAGPEVLTFSLARCSETIRPPPKGPTWDVDWDSAKRLAREFVERHNATLAEARS